MWKNKAKTNMSAVVIGALTILLALNIAVCVGAFMQELEHYEISGSSMLNAIEWEQYYRLCELTGGVSAERREQDETVDECCYIADYYEAASLYRAYAGDEAHQQDYQQTMDSCRAGVTTLGYTLDEIDAIFEIG